MLQDLKGAIKTARVRQDVASPVNELCKSHLHPS